MTSISQLHPADLAADSLGEFGDELDLARVFIRRGDASAVFLQLAFLLVRTARILAMLTEGSLGAVGLLSLPHAATVRESNRAVRMRMMNGAGCGPR